MRGRETERETKAGKDGGARMLPIIKKDSHATIGGVHPMAIPAKSAVTGTMSFGAIASFPNGNSNVKSKESVTTRASKKSRECVAILGQAQSSRGMAWALQKDTTCS